MIIKIMPTHIIEYFCMWVFGDIFKSGNDLRKFRIHQHVLDYFLYNLNKWKKSNGSSWQKRKKKEKQFANNLITLLINNKK